MGKLLRYQERQFAMVLAFVFNIHTGPGLLIEA